MTPAAARRGDTNPPEGLDAWLASQLPRWGIFLFFAIGLIAFTSRDLRIALGEPHPDWWRHLIRVAIVPPLILLLARCLQIGPFARRGYAPPRPVALGTRQIAWRAAAAFAGAMAGWLIAALRVSERGLLIAVAIGLWAGSGRGAVSGAKHGARSGSRAARIVRRKRNSNRRG